MIAPPASFPTSAHESAATWLTEYFAGFATTEAVVLVNSCARGHATADSCLDINVLVPVGEDIPSIECKWTDAYRSEPVFEDLKRAGQFAEVHLDIVNGDFSPPERDEVGGPDGFELWIGNFVAYGMPLWERSDRYRKIRRQWMPYNSDELREERLATALFYCRLDLDHIPLYVRRGLYFQSFDRLYNAYRGFLQALFISRRTYPIAYDKWIKEQVGEILGLPDLYDQLPRLFEIEKFESEELIAKAETLRGLMESYVLE